MNAVLSSVLLKLFLRPGVMEAYVILRIHHAYTVYLN